MDSSSNHCLKLLLVIVVLFDNYKAAGITTPAPGGNNAQAASSVNAATAAASGNVQTAAPSGNGVTAAPSGNAMTAAPPSGGNPTQAITSKSPKYCIKGECVAAGDDESCIGKISGKCTFVGSCNKTVTKNQTHSVFKVDCGPTTCPTVTTTTTVKPTPAAGKTTTTTNLCCTDPLCNQFQPKSAAVRISKNVLHFGGVLLFVAFL